MPKRRMQQHAVNQPLNESYLLVPSKRNSVPKGLCECGCGQKTKVCTRTDSKRGRKKGQPFRFVFGHVQQWKHGHNQNGKRTSEYRAWDGMIARCYRPSHSSYKNYGARGISVCEKWRKSFLAFLSDMGRKPTPKHTLERINGKENYVPSNCKWATYHEQALNKRPHRKNAPGKYAKFVTFNRNRFIAYVTILGTGKQKYLGSFKTEIEASKAAQQEVLRQGG